MELRTDSSTKPLEIAGALQSVMHDIPYRNYSLDIQQEVAITEIGKHLLDGQQSGYIEMATSTGKTTLEALVAEAGIRSGKRVLIVAPTKAIAAQISGSHRDTPTGIAKFTNLHETTSVGHHFGTTRANDSDQLVVSTYSGLVNNATTGELGEFDIIIADECHRSLGQKTAHVMKSVSPNAIKLGFSATPDYATDRKAEEVFGDKIFEFSLIDAIESGKTAPLRTLIYETDVTLALSDNRSEFTEKELAPLINNIERNGTAYQLAVDFAKDGRQGIIACIPGAGNVHARMMASMLSESDNITAADVGAHLSDEENAFRLKAFHEGDITILTFTRALEEGWDSDKANFCINMVPTASPVRTKQLMGRVLRKNVDARESIYVDFIDTKEGVAKQQYTAMHALDLTSIDFARVLGHYNSNHTRDWQVPSSLDIPAISDSLLQRIKQSQGKLIDEIGISQRQKLDPLTLHWERILEKEGLPADLEDNDILPATLNRRIESSYSSFVAEHGREPSINELIEAMGSVDRWRAHAMGYYGLRVPLESVEITAGKNVDPHELISYKLLKDKLLPVVFDTLTERESGIISLRYGLFDEPKTYDEIGRIYGITGARVASLMPKVLSKLRHPYRSQMLSGYEQSEGSFDKDKSSPQLTREKRMIDHLLKELKQQAHIVYDDEYSQPRVDIPMVGYYFAVRALEIDSSDPIILKKEIKHRIAALEHYSAANQMDEGIIRRIRNELESQYKNLENGLIHDYFRQ